MTQLAGESCSVCKAGDVSITADEQQDLLEQLPGWALSNRDGLMRLEKVYPFENFGQALDFANAVGELAEGSNHHPAILVEWGKTTVTWWTHTIDALHRNDFVMAAKTDYLHGK